MIQEFNIKRGGKGYKVFKGVEDGANVLYLETLEPNDNGLIERYYFASLYIETDKLEAKGTAALIKTEWHRVEISPNGKVLTGNRVLEWGNTKQDDIKAFNEIFGEGIMMSILNNLITDTMGFNHLPVIDTRIIVDGKQNPNFGSILEYSEFLENSAPTNDYRTFKEGDDLPDELKEK